MTLSVKKWMIGLSHLKNEVESRATSNGLCQEMTDVMHEETNDCSCQSKNHFEFPAMSDVACEAMNEILLLLKYLIN